MIVCILGRQPHIGAAELESLYGAARVRLLPGDKIALVDVPHISYELGGSIKIARQIDTISTTKFEAISTQLTRRLSRYLVGIPAEGKVKFGISVYGIQTNVPQLTRTTLYLKKTIKKTGHSARVVPNNDLTLSSAQVIHNQLTSPLGLELLLIRDGDQTIVAQTFHEQDIEAYTLRDRGRPKRDAFVGMLPPKLAQIMVHLGTQQASRLITAGDDTLQPTSDQTPELLSDMARSSVDNGNNQKGTILDPFCGTGVVLQEAALEGYAVYGTDISEKMVNYTKDNLKWLSTTHKIALEAAVERGDATSYTWKQPIDAVVGEGYLGQPMSFEPTREKLAEIMHECNGIFRDFLKNIHPQLQPGTPLCIAAPAWFVLGETQHLSALDDLENLGYNRIDFEHANRTELIYHREDQIVGRELLVLIRR